MKTTILGRTGLAVSVAGLGCGGNSRVGLGRGLPRAESIRLVRAAIDRGVNFIDTAEAYGTEEIVGEALRGLDRTSVVISTKAHADWGDSRTTPDAFAAKIDAALMRLGTDFVDVFHVHAVLPKDYDRVREEIVPVLLKAREAGKVRHLGLTESPPRDPAATMMTRAVRDPQWEVVMLAFHMMNQRPAATILPATRANGIGTLAMFAVRNIFSRPERLRATLDQLASEGAVPAELAKEADPLAALIDDAGAHSLQDLAYRFVRHTPGIDVVLFGTSRIDHMEANIASITAPPLAPGAVERMRALFGALQGVGLDAPDHVRSAP
jgi:aryl-alcohol dehydrogenase-like predicted oxidoreductase